MSKRRDLSLKRYDISKYAYRELLNFCRQYPEKKAKLQHLYSISASMVSEMPRKTGNNQSSTEQRAIKAAALSADVELIEKTAMEAGKEIYWWLIKNVTQEGNSWEYMPVPRGRRQFYEARRKFFYLLALKKGMI